MTYSYEPQGVCSQEMIIEINEENDTIVSVQIIGGCPGNTVGVAKLCAGKTIDEVIELLKGIDCRGRGTSCPDQLAIALEKIKETKSQKED